MLSFSTERRGIALRRTTSLAVLAFAVGCTPSLESHFRERGYDWPLHWDRGTEAVIIASDRPGKLDPACVADPDRAPFLRAALSRLRGEELRGIARRYCSEAKSWAFVAPFVVTSDLKNGEYLAMHVECFGKGVLPGGIRPELAQHPNRAPEIDRALDGWKVYDRKDYWVKWNIALFRITDGATVFDSLIGRHTPDREYELIIPEATDPLFALQPCGRGGASQWRMKR